MDEQRISLPLTPTSNELDADNPRRHCMGKAPSSRSDEKVLPHYLRASTGSCHDFCKFGRKHAFEEKTRLPFSRRNARKPRDELNSMELDPESNRTSKVTCRSTSSTKTPPEIIKQEVPKRLLDRKSPLMNVVAAEKKKSSGALFTKSADSQSPVLRDVLAKKKTMAKNLLTESIDSQISVSSDNWAEKRKTSLREKNKTSLVNVKTSTGSKTHLSPKFTKPSASPSSERKEVSSEHASSVVKKENIAAKRANSVKVKSSSPDSARVLNIRGNSDNQVAQKMSSSKVAIKKVQKSPRALLFPKTSGSEVSRVASPRASLSVKPTLRVQMSPRPSLAFKPSLNKVASLNARKNWGSEVVSSLKNQSKIKKANDEHIKKADYNQSIEEHKGSSNDVVQEKTLYVIKMNTENNCLESDRKENFSTESSPPPSPSKSPSIPEAPSTSSNNEEDEEESEYAASEAEDEFLSEYEEIEGMEKVDAVIGERKGWHRKPGMIPSDDKNDLPVKLRFRRGKVIDIKTEHNSPRRLKFRRGRVLGENLSLKADTRRSFKRGGAEDVRKDGNPDSQKVVLRHQDVHGQKDAQGLFNNVIEETASKLVETRKSKVKALVGAFETVISLQDSKAPVSPAS